MMTYGTIIVIKRSGVDGSSFPLMSNTCLIGRDSTCDIRIQLPTVSQQHSQIDVLDDGQILLTNLSSTNPTTLNNHVIKKCVHIHHMDVFTIADRSFRWEFPPNSQYYSPKRSPSPMKYYGSPPFTTDHTNEYPELAGGSKSTPGGEHRSFKVLLGSPPRHSQGKRSLQKPLSSGKKVPYLLSPRPGKYTPKKKLTSKALVQLSPMRELPTSMNEDNYSLHLSPTSGKTPLKRLSTSGKLIKSLSPKTGTQTPSPKSLPGKTPSPKILSGNTISKKKLSGKAILKRLSEKSSSPKTLPGKTPLKRLSDKTSPKLLSGKTPSPKVLPGKILSPKSLPGKTLSPKGLSEKISPKSLLGKTPSPKIEPGKTSPKVLTGKISSPKSLPRKTPSPKESSGKTSPKNLSGKIPSPKDLPGNMPSPKSLPGRIPSPKRQSGKVSPKSQLKKTPSPKRLSGRTPSPKSPSGKTPSPKVLSGKTPSPKILAGETSSIKSLVTPKTSSNVSKHLKTFKDPRKSLTPSPQKLRGRASAPGSDSGKRKRSIAILSKHRRSGPTLRKNVSFGPNLSPEHFDKKMPVSTPLKKGRRPQRSSSSSTTNSSDSSVLTPAIVARQGKRSQSPSAQIATPKAKKAYIKEATPTSSRSNSLSPKTPSKRPSSGKVKKGERSLPSSSKRASKGEGDVATSKRRKSMTADKENVVKIDSPASPDSKKSAALRTIHASKFRLSLNKISKSPSPFSPTKLTKSRRFSFEKKLSSSGSQNSAEGRRQKSLRISTNSNYSGLADMLRTPASSKSLRSSPAKSRRLSSSVLSRDTSFDMQSFQTPNVPSEVFVSPMTIARTFSPSFSLKRMMAASPKSTPVRNASTRVKSRFTVKSPISDYTDVTGVKRLMKSPRKSPISDYTDVTGVKRLMKSPRKSPRSDYTDVTGVKRLMKSPRKSPKSDYTDVRGVKRLMNPRKSPISDYSDVTGIKRLWKSPKNSPNFDDLDISFKTPIAVQLAGSRSSFVDMSDSATMPLSDKRLKPKSVKKTPKTRNPVSLSSPKSPRLTRSARAVTSKGTPLKLRKMEVGTSRKVSPISPGNFYPIRRSNDTEADSFNGESRSTSKPLRLSLTPSPGKTKKMYSPKSASPKLRLTKSPIIPKSARSSTSSHVPTPSSSKSPGKSGPSAQRVHSIRPPQKYSPATVMTPTKQYPKRNRKQTPIASSPPKRMKRAKKNEATSPEISKEDTEATPVQVKSKGKSGATSTKSAPKKKKSEKATPKVKEVTRKRGKLAKSLENSPVASKGKITKAKKATTKAKEVTPLAKRRRGRTAIDSENSPADSKGKITKSKKSAKVIASPKAVASPPTISPRRTRQGRKKVSPKKPSPVSQKKKTTKASSPAKTIVARATRRSKRT